MSAIHPDFIFSVIDFSGVFAAALGGAIEAERHPKYEYDVVGVVGLSLVAALGGGITRDLIIQHGPPLAFTDLRYLLLALAGAFVGILFERNLGIRTQRTVLVVEAAVLGLFAVAGSTRAVDNGLRFLPAVLLGVLTAVGGGVLRDVLSATTPRIFERGQLYAVVATFASVLFLACNAIGLHRSASTAIGAGCGFLLRLLALRFNWQTKAIRRMFRGAGGNNIV